MTRKKLSLRIVSFLSALAMIIMILPNDLTAFAAVEDHISVTINHFGLDVEDGGEVANGTQFAVSLEGTIDSGYMDTTLPLTFDIPLDIEGVQLSGSGNVNFNGSPAGEFTVDADGTIHVTIFDNAAGNSFINQGKRDFSLDFSAKIQANENDDGTAVDTTIKIAEVEKDVKVVFPDSSLYGEKVAVGDAWYDPDTDEIYQTYTITQTAKDGKVTDVTIFDYMGEWLSGPMYYNEDGDYFEYDTVKVTRTFNGSSSDDYLTSEEFQDANGSGFYVEIPEINKNETITITYTLAIDKEYFKNNYDTKSINQFGSDYDDQNGGHHDPTPGSDVQPNIERPGVVKSGNFTVKGDEVEWTIVVDAGVFESADDFINDFSITVTDKPGDGLADEGKSIVLPTYTDNGDGTYTFTYNTKLTDEVMAQLKDITKTVTVHNDVEGGNDDFTFSGEADATREGIGILDKKATATEPDENGRFAWRSTLTVPIEGINNLVFTDSTALSPNGHKIVKDSIKIDGYSIADLEQDGKVTVTVSGKTLRVEFSDDFLAQLQKANAKAYNIKGYEDPVYLAEIVITYLTQPDDASDLDDSYTFTNRSDIEYTITDDGTKVTDTDSDEYFKKVIPKKYYDKSAYSSNGDWEILINGDDVTLDKLSVGDVFKITDTPENMEIIEDTIIPYLYANWNYTKLTDICDDVDSYLTFMDNKNGTYTFTFTITQELYDAVNSVVEDWARSYTYFTIAYSTRIIDPDLPSYNGYNNTAGGSFNGKPAEQTTATKYTSVQNPVSKSSIYEYTNTQFDYGVSNGKINIRYEVSVNPSSMLYGNENYVYLTDKMSEGLIMIPASVVLTDTATGNVLKNGVDYFVDFDEDKNEMYFTVPNGKSMLLTYMAELKGDMPDVGQTGTSAYSTDNSIEFYAADGTTYTSEVVGKGEIYRASGELKAEGYSVTIVKISEINGTKIFPQGAEFEVKRVNYDPQTGTYTDAENNMQGENILVTTVEGTNQTKITGLVPDAIYRLVETKAPSGFVLSQEPVYFIFKVDWTDPLPPEIQLFTDKDVYYYENQPDFGSLVLTKTVDAQNVTDAELRGALKFTVQNENGKYVDADGELHDEKVEITLKSFKKQLDGTFVLTIPQLPTGNYTITETNTELAGYRLVSSASVTSGEAEITAGNTAQVDLKDSYEETGSLKITKSVDGLNVTDEEKAGALTFTVQNEDGKYLDEKGELHDEEVKITLDKFTKQADGTYVLEFENIVTGEYTVTETNTEIEGYEFVSSASTTSGDATVTKGETAEIKLKDSYEAKIGNLKITKSIDGLNVTDEEKAGALKFTVQDENGNYLDETGKLHDGKVEITLDKFTKQDDGTYVLEIKDIPAGKYTVTETNTEIDGYKFVSEESVTNGEATVTKGNTSTVELKDSYEEVGNLKITKTVDAENITDAELKGALKFTVQDKNGKYLDDKGELHDEKVEITLDKFTKQDDGTYVLEFENVVVGKYTVTETNTEIDGYKFVSDESVTSGEATVTKGETATIELKDSYEALGNLKITKSVDGLNVTDEEKAGALKFTVQDENGKYLDEKGNMHDEKVEITLDKFTKQDDGTYVLEFKDVVTGKYTVTETNTEIDGYKFVSDESVTSGEATVTKGETATVELKDSYEALGNLKITKSVDGLNVTDEEKAGALKFTVQDKNGKYLDEKGELHDEKVEITLDKFTQQDDGTYVLEFKDVVTGKYTVTETNTEIDGYKFVSDESVTSGEATVTKGETATIELKDSYEALGNLKITKSVDGLNVTDEEKAGALTFTVQNEDGKYLDENGELHDEKVEITLDKFTQQEDGTYVLEFKDIVVGKYTVTETNTEIDGYKFVSEESVTNGEATVTKGETATIELKDSYEKTTSVTINKKDVANDEEVEGAKLVIYDKDNNVIDEWTSEKGKTHTIKGLKPGEEYTLRETITPDGYETATDIVFTVDEDGNVTVVSGDDGHVDDDGVLIVNDTKQSDDDDSSQGDDDSSKDDDDSSKEDDDSSKDNDDSSDNNTDDLVQTGYGAKDALPMILLTSSALIVVAAKKRNENEDEE